MPTDPSPPGQTGLQHPFWKQQGLAGSLCPLTLQCDALTPGHTLGVVEREARDARVDPDTEEDAELGVFFVADVIGR